VTASGALRARVLSLLAGEPVDQTLCFSGLINVTRPGLDTLGLQLAEVHTDAERMAAAAATTPRMFGFAAAAVPLDMCVEAEMLGATVDFSMGGDGTRLPQPVATLASSASEWTIEIPDNPANRRRVPVVCEAIRILKREAGQDFAVGAWIPGPFTLATMVVDVVGLVMETRTAPDAVGKLLDDLTDLLIKVAVSYHDAGADFLTIHEMGGSPGFIGPPAFEALVLPRLRRLLAALPAPRVLHVCGNTNMAMELLEAAGADALSVDQLNDIARSREVLGPSHILFGNIDPIGVLSDGTPRDVRAAVSQAVADGVSAVWPGCDLMPHVAGANLKAMVE
jgi:[methyl-Co(III) methanol-specific corrinoid protein]:coenzyme M methyltransferase